MSGPRFAIYFVPRAETALYRFGAAVLGYDCYTGASLPYPAFTGPDWPEVTIAPRAYGFHATLKAPICLAEGSSEAELAVEFSRFAAQRRQAPKIALEVCDLEGFVALVPREENAALQSLAADCVSHFDRFRAPLTPEDLLRRRKGGLTARQDAFLMRWGYPYVFEEFRFHMTLTGQVGTVRRPDILRSLRAWFAQQCKDDTVTVDHLALARQNKPPEPFQVVAQASITP